MSYCPLNYDQWKTTEPDPWPDERIREILEADQQLQWEWEMWEWEDDQEPDWELRRDWEEETQTDGRPPDVWCILNFPA